MPSLRKMMTTHSIAKDEGRKDAMKELRKVEKSFGKDVDGRDTLPKILPRVYKICELCYQ